MQRVWKRDARLPLVALAVAATITLSLTMTGCTSREKPQEANSSEQNKALVMRVWEEVVNQGNLDKADELFAKNYVYHNTSGQDFTGIEEGVKVTVTSMKTAFPDLHCTVDDIIAEGDRVAQRWSATGTHSAEYMGVPATQNQVHMTGIVISRIENGKVAEDWSCGDDLGILQQLGGFLASGRTDYTWGTPQERGKGEPCSSDHTKALYQREFEEVWTLGNLNALDEILDPGFVNHDPPWPHVADFESFKTWGDSWINKAPDMQVTIEDIVVEGNMLAGRWTATWTDEKGLIQFGPTGKKLTIQGIDIIRCVDGKVVERWWAKDNLGVLKQLELIRDMPEL
jgi:steroid delta-isomerase-like uncharacterized protein